MPDPYIEPCRSPEAAAGVCEYLLGRHCGRRCQAAHDERRDGRDPLPLYTLTLENET